MHGWMVSIKPGLHRPCRPVRRVLPQQSARCCQAVSSTVARQESITQCVCNMGNLYYARTLTGSAVPAMTLQFTSTFHGYLCRCLYVGCILVSVLFMSLSGTLSDKPHPLCATGTTRLAAGPGTVRLKAALSGGHTGGRGHQGIHPAGGPSSSISIRATPWTPGCSSIASPSR